MVLNITIYQTIRKVVKKRVL